MDRKTKNHQPQKRKTAVHLALAAVYGLFIGFSFLWDFEAGKAIGREGWRFFSSMLSLFPAAFLLIGLFEVWVDRSVIEKHLGENSGMKSHIWAILLASTIMAPLIVALPVAHSLAKKGARPSIVISFVGASTICRIHTILSATPSPSCSRNMAPSAPMILSASSRCTIPLQ